MVTIWNLIRIQLVVLTLCCVPAIGIAADFELFWDPNCSTDSDLEGYYIYYKEDASVVDDPNGAIEVYVSLSDSGFDPSEPAYLVSGLLDDVHYCFTVTAWYGDEESDLSNEVCGINGAYATGDPDPDPDPDSTPSNSVTDSSSGGCFIGLLK